MRKNLLAAILLINLSVAFAQVTITAPYEYGQILLRIGITYPASIVKPDSVALEVNFGSDFQKIKSESGKPMNIYSGYTFGHRFDKNRKYRVAVYQKGKSVVYSNEVGILYDAEFAYSDKGLPNVNDVKATLIEKNGATYIHFTWTPVAGTIGYRLFIEERGQMIWEASIGDQGYFYTNSCDYLVYTHFERKYTFGIGAVEGPDDNTDADKLTNKVTITVPKK